MREVDSLFEVIKDPGEHFKDYVDRFESTLVCIENPDQRLVLTAFNKGVLADPTVLNGTSYNNLLFNSYKRYQDAKTLIANHIKLEQLRKTIARSTDAVSQTRKTETYSDY